LNPPAGPLDSQGRGQATQRGTSLTAGRARRRRPQTRPAPFPNWLYPTLRRRVSSGAFALYAAYVRCCSSRNGRYGPYLSPFTSPEIHVTIAGDRDPHRQSGSSGRPLGFRLTCYYYRRAIFRGYLWHPRFVAAVGEPAPRDLPRRDPPCSSTTTCTASPFYVQGRCRWPSSGTTPIAGPGLRRHPPTSGLGNAADASWNVVCLSGYTFGLSTPFRHPRRRGASTAFSRHPAARPPPVEGRGPCSTSGHDLWGLASACSRCGPSTSTSDC